MGIDKIKKKKKKRKIYFSGKRVGFEPGGMAGSDGRGGDGGSSSSSSSDDGDNDNNYSAPAPSYSVQDDIEDFATNVGSTASVDGGFEDDSSGDDFEEDVVNVMEELGIKDTFNSPTVDVSTITGEDGLGEGDYDDGRSLYTSNTQTTKENQPYVNYTPGPNAVTAAQLAAFNQNPGTSDNIFSLTENKIRATNPIEEPKKGILSQAGNFLKNAAINIGGTMAFGPSFLKMRNTYKAAQFIDDRFLNDKIPGMSFAKATGGEPPAATGFDDNDSGINNIIPKNVIASNIQKYSPEYINRAIDYRDKLQAGVESGAVLSKIGQQTLTGLNQLINQYQVEPETMIT